MTLASGPRREPSRAVASRGETETSLSGSRELVSKRHSLRSQPSSEGLAPWVVPSAPLPQGDSLWLAHSANCMRQAPRKRSGPVADFMGYYSTPVRILQGGCGSGGSRGGGDGWFCCGLRRYPARSALQRFWVQGDSLYPRRGLCPLHPAGRRSRACVGASGSFLTFRWVRGQGLRGRREGAYGGGRRYAARSTLQRFWVQGDSLYARRGLPAPAPCLGTEAASFPHLARSDAS